MKNLIAHPVVASSIATCAFFASAPAVSLDAAERCALVATADDSLLELRAGAPLLADTLAASERTTLARAQAADPSLLDLRAGAYLTRDEWIIITVALVAILIIVIAA